MFSPMVNDISFITYEPNGILYRSLSFTMLRRVSNICNNYEEDEEDVEDGSGPMRSPTLSSLSMCKVDVGGGM